MQRDLAMQWIAAAMGNNGGVAASGEGSSAFLTVFLTLLESLDRQVGSGRVGSLIDQDGRSVEKTVGEVGTVMGRSVFSPPPTMHR